MDQSQTPLADAAAAYLADPSITPFTTPGHKRAPHLADDLLRLDLPLSSGADDLHMRSDVLGQAERLAAALWDADLCRFCGNGSTEGNQALALALGRPGDRAIVSRSTHKSVLAGLVLSGLQPVWVRPDVDPATGLPLALPPERVADALASAPDARGVFLVEPNFVGVLSDLPRIAELAHAAGIPLVIDQAWGAHLGFPPGSAAALDFARRGRVRHLGAQDPGRVHAERLPARARGAPRPRAPGRVVRAPAHDERFRGAARQPRPGAPDHGHARGGAADRDAAPRRPRP